MSDMCDIFMIFWALKGLGSSAVHGSYSLSHRFKLAQSTPAAALGGCSMVLAFPIRWGLYRNWGCTFTSGLASHGATTQLLSMIPLCLQTNTMQETLWHYPVLLPAWDESQLLCAFPEEMLMKWFHLDDAGLLLLTAVSAPADQHQLFQ